jgi:hypothetical protein
MTDTKTLEELKDPKKAQPFGIYEKYYPEKASLLKRAGKENCLGYLTRGGKKAEWLTRSVDSDCNFCRGTTYILKPDYTPELEYVDLEIVEHEGWLGLHGGFGTVAPYHFTQLHCLQSLPGFEEFWYDDEGSHITPWPHSISKLIRKGYTLYAKFRKGES